MKFPLRMLLVWICLFTAGMGRCALAQGAQDEEAPYTAWLDFNRRAADRWAPADLPSWLESVRAEARLGGPDRESGTIFRLRFRELRQINKDMQLRLFFQDREDAAPIVSGYSETGAVTFRTRALGQDLGLPTSEAMIFSTAGTDMIEIEVPGDGSNVRGAFLTLLKTQEVRRALDFNTTLEIIEVFGQPAPLKLAADDSVLYGRVKAALDRDAMKLSLEEASFGTWEFDLGAVPLLALVTFEVLNADSEAPLQVLLNDRPLGAPEIQWPDLADPGYLGLVRPLETGMRFRYSGWLRVQKIVPGSALQVGVNRLVLQLSPDSGPMAVRAVELQLKHNWKNLDYQLAPSAP